MTNAQIRAALDSARAVQDETLRRPRFLDRFLDGERRPRRRRHWANR